MRFTVALVALLLSGCQLAALKPPGADAYQLSSWLRLSERIAELTPEEARLRLERLGDSDSDLDRRFHFALLNQQLGERDGWVVARDRLRLLSREPELSRDARQLAGLLEQFNQLRINSDQQLVKLRSERDDLAALAEQSRAEAALLEEKIRALTTLEDSMRQRREKRNGHHE